MGIVTAFGLWWIIIVLAAALNAMGRAMTPPSEQGARSRARQSLELRGYTIRRFILGGKHEVRSPNGQIQLFGSAEDFVVWARHELR
jgi:hypothetical protein